MHIQRVILFLAAAFFVVYGIAFSLFPADMALLVTGSEPATVSGAIDFRATYGGMTVAVGVALLYLDSIRQYRAGLAMVIIVLMAMALTRTIGLFAEGAGNVLMYVYLVLELLGSALALFALRTGAGSTKS